MSPSSSPSDPEPFGFLTARGPVAAATSTASWLQALLDAEAALARAHAEVGAVTAEQAEVVAAACRAERFDAGAVFRDAELGGNPVIALVPVLRAAVGDDAAPAVHRGATSQDIVDTATMLVVRRCTRIAVHGLERAGAAVARLQADHGTTPMMGRTLLQHAVPTTVTTLTTRWRSALGAASAALERVDAELPVQLGGPVGDLAPFQGQGPALVESMARQLDLAVPAAPWHTVRTPVAAVAGAWGLAASAVAGIALDVVLLAGSDLGEVREHDVAAGRSSSMEHKRNPVAAVSARAAALQAPGLVATLLHCAGGHELERAAGSWHAEWPAVHGLLRATASSVAWLGCSLQRLVVDESRMADNLARSTAPGVGR